MEPAGISGLGKVQFRNFNLQYSESITNFIKKMPGPAGRLSDFPSWRRAAAAAARLTPVQKVSDLLQYLEKPKCNRVQTWHVFRGDITRLACKVTPLCCYAMGSNRWLSEVMYWCPSHFELWLNAITICTHSDVCNNSRQWISIETKLGSCLETMLHDLHAKSASSQLAMRRLWGVCAVHVRRHLHISEMRGQFPHKLEHSVAFLFWMCTNTFKNVSGESSSGANVVLTLQKLLQIRWKRNASEFGGIPFEIVLGR